MIWTRRWETLKAAGLTRSQALVVYRMLDESYVFGTARLAESALRQLREVYEEEELRLEKQREDWDNEWQS